LILLPPISEQDAIAHVLQRVQEAIQTRQDEIKLERERKAALMEYLFTHGTRGETTKQTMVGEIPESWTVIKVGEIVTLQRGFDITRKEQRAGKIPVVSSSGVLSYHDTAMVKGPGVIIGRKGSLGTVFYVEDDYWPHDATLWVKDFHGNHPRFIYYFLKSLNFKHFDVGSSNPTLNRNHVHTIQVGRPEVSEQREIAELLTACDTKISLLEQESTLLDELFRALLEELMTGRLSTLPLIEEGETHG
jgi:type I restriction enzyme S subunit